MPPPEGADEEAVGPTTRNGLALECSTALPARWRKGCGGNTGVLAQGTLAAYLSEALRQDLLGLGRSAEAGRARSGGRLTTLTILKRESVGERGRQSPAALA